MFIIIQLYALWNDIRSRLYAFDMCRWVHKVRQLTVVFYVAVSSHVLNKQCQQLYSLQQLNLTIMLVLCSVPGAPVIALVGFNIVHVPAGRDCRQIQALEATTVRWYALARMLVCVCVAFSLEFVHTAQANEGVG